MFIDRPEMLAGRVLPNQNTTLIGSLLRVGFFETDFPAFPAGHASKVLKEDDSGGYRLDPFFRTFCPQIWDTQLI